ISDRSLDPREPGVKERYAGLSRDRFHVTTDPTEAVHSTDLTFVIVPTPSNTLGGFSLRYVLSAIEQVGAAIQRKKHPHTVALISTVLPGSSDRVIIPRLETASKRKVNDGLGYAYNPVFIALGDIVNGFEVPDYLLIGEATPQAGEVILAAHRS